LKGGEVAGSEEILGIVDSGGNAELGEFVVGAVIRSAGLVEEGGVIESGVEVCREVGLEAAEEFEISLEIAEMVGQEFGDEVPDWVPASGGGADEQAGLHFDLVIANGVGGRGGEGGEDARDGVVGGELRGERSDERPGLADAAAFAVAVVFEGSACLVELNR
jgi:hypothetical protein